MNMTHRKNTAEGGTFSMTYRKWFTRSVACMALLFAAGNVSAATVIGTKTTWDFNNSLFNASSKWIDNNDTAQFGALTIGVNTNSGPVGAKGLITVPITGGAVTITFTNHPLLIGAGGMTMAGPVTFNNNVQLTANQVWSDYYNYGVNNISVAGNLSGSGNLTFDALNQGNKSYGVDFPTLVLYGSNTLSGTMTVQNTGALMLDYINQNNSKLDTNSALIVSNSAVIQWKGGASAFTQAVNGLTLAGPGYFELTRVNSNNVLQVGTITRTGEGSTLLFGNASNAVTTSSANTNGILGAWATTASGWAYNTTGGANGPLGNFLGTNDTNTVGWTATENVSMTNKALVILAGSKTINTLRLGGTTNFNLGGNTLTLAAGGLMATTATKLGNGFIQSGLASGELFVYANTVVTNSATIRDNETTPTVLVKAGTSTLVLTGPNTYSGATYVNDGELLLADGGAIISTNPISVSINGILTFKQSDTFSTTNTLTGNGTIQSTGSGTVNLTTANSTIPIPRYLVNGSVNSELINSGSGALNLILGGTNTFGQIRNTSSGTVMLTGAGSVNTGYSLYVSGGSMILTNVSMGLTGASSVGIASTSVGSYLLIAGTNGPNNHTTLDLGDNAINMGAGAGCSNNYVMVSAGGVLTNVSGFSTAHSPGGFNNGLIVTNGGQVFAGSVGFGYTSGNNGNYIYVGGADSSGNNALLSCGGIIIGNGWSVNNTTGCWMKVEQGGVVSNATTLALNTVGNYLIVTNGGYFGQTSKADLGGVAGADNNRAQVIGSGSQWLVGTTLSVGAVANNNGNTVSVTDGGLLEIKTGISVGNATSSGNTVTVNGGILQFTTKTPAITIGNSAQNGIVIADTTISYKGLTVANRVNLTNNWGNSGLGTNGVAWSGNNTLRLDNSAATNSLGRPYIFDTFNPVAPTNYVGLELLGSSAIYGKGITIGANGTMLLLSDATAIVQGGVTNFGSIAGSGTISSLVTMAGGSSLSPAGTGTLAFSTNLTFTGTGTYNWNYNASAGSLVTVGGTLTMPAAMNLTVNGIGELPANATLFTWPEGTAAPSTTWNVSPDKYAVKTTSTGFSLVLRAGTLISIY